MATEGNSEPRKRGCLARLLRGCGWALLILVALVLGSYLVEVYRCSRFTPTGDALFDKYARAVIKRQAWRLFSNRYLDSELLSLDAGTLREWENEFGDDSRYWLLCFSCPTNDDQILDDTSIEQGLSEKYYFLDQAIQRGCADVNVLYFAFRQQSDWWLTLTEEDYFASKPTVVWKKLSPLEQQAKMQALYGAEIELWLDRMIEAAPDESFPYYRRARHHFVNGDFDLALKDLEAGNKATINRYPSLFPASLIREKTASDEGLDASCVNCLIAYFYCQGDELSDFRVYKGVVKESLEHSKLTDDPRWRIALHDFTVKFAGLRPDEDLFPMISSFMQFFQAEHFLVADGDKLSVEQRDDLLSLVTRNHSNVLRLVLNEPQGIDNLWLYVKDQSFTVRILDLTIGGFTGEYYQHWFDNVYVEMINNNSAFASRLEGISTFNYETFRWPEPDDP